MNRILLALALVAPAAAECPNACSGHGTCGAFDECSCYPNWQEADCSGRTCPFGLGHVDTPKGDLDGSADALSGPTTTVISDSTVYPYGTTEQYPAMVDSAGAVLTNTAHAYAECSNKGICDRSSGECDCFPGYAGAGCQRAACPDPTCSGHGTCMNAQDLAAADNDNTYLLWDKEVSMGCVCEPGYDGPTCGNKMCKYGVDPLYDDDDFVSIRAPTARVIMTNTAESNSVSASYIDRYNAGLQDYSPLKGTVLSGTYAIKFYDAFGEDYETEPIAVAEFADLATGVAHCAEVSAALEALPNSVIPAGSVRCTPVDDDDDGTIDAASDIQYDLLFEENPGNLKPIEINANLDGLRPTVYFSDQNTTHNVVDYDAVVEVYPNYDGISGEFVDYFPTYCSGVTISVDPTFVYARNVFSIAKDVDADEAKLLKKCLGDADGDADNNVEVYNWDYGMYNTTMTPHIVKLAPHPTAGSNPKVDVYDAGKFHLAYYDGSDFFFSGLPDATRDYAVFTTEGTATVIGNSSILSTDGMQGSGGGGQSSRGEDAFDANPTTAYFAKGSSIVYTSMDVSCYSAKAELNTCLSKGDKVFLFNSMALPPSSADTDAPTVSESTGNMYEVVKIGVNPISATTYDTEDRFYFVVDKVINYDGSATKTRASLSSLTSVWGSDNDATNKNEMGQKVGAQLVVKFEPSADDQYEFVAQCSGRGLCNGDSGLCECFTGYTNDNCDQQSALAV